MLTNYQLLYITNNHICTEDYLNGIYSLDNIPSYVNKFPSFFIANNKPESHPGEHWFGCFFPSKAKPAEMFCSLGNRPESYLKELDEILRANSNGSYVYNKVQVQSSKSKTCGYFVLYYIDRRCRGLSFENCMATFNGKTWDENEEIVMSYVKRHIMNGE